MYVYGHEMLLLLLLLRIKKKTLGFLSSKHTQHTHTPDCLFTKPHEQKEQGKNPREGATDKQTNNNKENLLFCLVHSTTLLHRTWSAKSSLPSSFLLPSQLRANKDSYYK
jgi:hypothetical protein